jgi:tetratricopeptide (TPR) repeat protein
MVQQGVKDLNAGNLDDAEQVFEQALRISPSFGKSYYYLGVLSYKRKDYKRSLAFLEQAETYMAGDDFWLSQVYLQEGLSLKALNLKDTAKKKFRLALEKDPKNDAAKKELDKLGP